MMQPKVKLTVKGTGVRIPHGKWRCRKCGQILSLPKVPASCEEYLCLCVPCGMAGIRRKLLEQTRNEVKRGDEREES